jgi:uncharacterized protein with FMN-binding domain
MSVYNKEVVMKKRYIAIIIVLLVLALGFITTKILLTRFEGNLKQLALSEISDVVLAAAEDGIYIGSYLAFPVSAEVRVALKNHAIEEIELLKHNNGQGQGAEIIPEKVIEAQSLKVDSVSGATYSSKVILKAILDAILKAGAKTT